MNNDSLLGNFFIELIKNKRESVTFEQIFDFVYYASLKLEEENKTTEILVSRSGICNFVETHNIFLNSVEEGNIITINLDSSKKIDFLNDLKIVAERIESNE